MNIPRGWSKALLREVAHVQTGLSKSEGRTGPSVRKRYLRVANVQDGFLDLTTLKEIDVPLTQVERFRLQMHDVLLTEGGDFDKLGRGCVWRNEVPDCVHQNHIFAVRVTKPQVMLPEFLACLIQSTHAKSYFMSCAKQTTNLASINSSQIRALPVLMPPIADQLRIIQAVSIWDIAIKKTEQLITLISSRKDWLIAKIIFADAPGVKFGSFLVPITRVIPKPLGPYWALGIRSHGKGTFQRYIEDPSTVDMAEVYQVKRNDLIVNITFAWEGAIAFVQPADEHCLVSHRFPTYQITEDVAYSGFVKYAVNHKSFFTKLSLISPGGAGRNRVLNKKDFFKLSIRLPSLEDQREYAAVLDTAEREIALLREQLAVLKKQKRGLMQKLLTGQWRLKDHKAEAA